MYALGSSIDNPTSFAPPNGAALPSLRLPIMTGAGAILLLFALLSLWSILAPLASATLASGTLVVETNRKVVQHLEGGIVRMVSVRDGDLVSIGDLLIQLDDTRLISSIQTLRPLLAINITQRARLEAERTGASGITFPVSQDELKLSDFGDIKDNQTRNFAARHLAVTNRLRILQSERQQLEAVLSGLRQQIGILDVRIGLVAKDMNVAIELESHGVGTQQHLRDVAKVLAELRGERAGLSMRIAETELKSEQTDFDAERLRVSFIEGVESEIQQTDREHLDLLDRYRSASEQLKRTRIEAPAAGKIVNLAVHTIGGIIGPGMALLEIVPDQDRLVIEAQIRPADIEAVKPGQSVRVRVSGSDARRLPFLNGTVLSVSADRILDYQRAGSYFLVRVGLNQEPIKDLDRDNLRPGMGVEIMITKNEKTVVEYLASPMMSFFAKGLHE